MPGVTAVGAGSGFSSVRMIPTIPPVADTDTPPVPSFASRFVATRWIDSPTFSNFTTGVATVADVMAPVEDDVPGAGAPSRNPNTVAPKFATEKSGKFVFASMLLATGTVTPLAEIELSVNCLDVVFTLIVTSPFTAAKSVTLTVSVPVAYRTMPGVTAVGAGSGFSSVRMIPTIPPVADAMAPVEDDVPGAGAPSRNPNTVAPKFATEKSGKFVFASMLLATGTVTPLAEIELSVNCLDVVFTLIVTSPFTSAKSVTLTINVPVAYRTMPGVIAVGAGSGFSSVRMIPTIPPVADTDTPPVASFASRFVATRWIDSPTFSNFTTGVATVADVMAPVEDDVPGAGAPSRNPNTVAPKFATEKSGKFVFASMLLATGTVTPLAEIELSVNCLDVVFTLIVTSPFTAAKSVTLTVSVPVAYRTMPGVTAVGAGSGFSSVRMIPTIPPVADTDTPPVPSFASRFVATRWIDSPTFSNFTTGVATVADVMAPRSEEHT